MTNPPMFADQPTDQSDDYLSGPGSTPSVLSYITLGGYLADLIGTDGADLLSGGDADEVIAGGDGDDTILAGGGDDVIDDGAGADYVYGAQGSDLFFVTDETVDSHAEPVNVYDGGSQADTISYRYSSFGWTVDLRNNEARNHNYRDSVFSVENVIGSNYNDDILGTDGRNELYGGRGEDYIWGYGGDDLISGGKGEDQLHGGAGEDTVSYLFSEGLVVVDLEAGTASARTDDGTEYDLVIDFENIIGSHYADTLTARDFRGATIEGKRGNDTIHGGRAGDELHGNKGEDTIYGGGGGDVIFGGQDDDRIYGENGNGESSASGVDFLYGGDGHDRLYAEADLSYLFGGEGNDAFRALTSIDADSVEARVIAEGGAGADIFHFNNHLVELTITDFNYSEDTLAFFGVYKKDPWLDFSNAVEVWPGPDEYDLIDRISDLDTNEDGWITASDSYWSLEDGDLVYETHGDAQTLRLVGVNGFSVDALYV